MKEKKKKDRGKIRKLILCGLDKQASSPIPRASPRNAASARNKTPTSQRSAHSSASTLSIVSKRARTPASQRSAHSSASTLSIVSKGATVEIKLRSGIPQRLSFLLNRIWRDVSKRPAPANITGRKTPRPKSVHKDNSTLSVVVEGKEGCFSPRPSSAASVEITGILSNNTKLLPERPKTRTLRRHRVLLSPYTASLPRIGDEDEELPLAADYSDGEDEELKNLKSNTPVVSPEPVASNVPNTQTKKATRSSKDRYEKRINVPFNISPPPSRMGGAPSRGPSRTVALPVATKKYTPSRKKHVVVPPENRQEVVNSKWPGWKDEFKEKMAKRDQIANGGLAYWVGDENAAEDKPKKKTSDGPGFIRRVLSKFKKSEEESSQEGEHQAPQPQINEQPSCGPEISTHVPHPPPGPAPARKKGNKGEIVPHPPAGPRPTGRKARVSTTSSDEEIVNHVPHPPAGPPQTKRRTVSVRVGPGIIVTPVNPKPLSPGERERRKQFPKTPAKSYEDNEQPGYSHYDSVEAKYKPEKPKKVRKPKKSENDISAETYTVYDIPGTYGEEVDVGVEVCSDYEYAPARSYEKYGQDYQNVDTVDYQPKSQKPKKDRKSKKTWEELQRNTSLYDTPCTTGEVITENQRNLYKTQAQKDLEREKAILRRAKLLRHIPYSEEYLAGRNRDGQNSQSSEEVASNVTKKPKKKKHKSRRLDEAAAAQGMERDPYPQHAVHDNSSYHYRQQARICPTPEDVLDNGRSPSYRVTAKKAAENMAFFLQHSRGKL